MNSASYRADSSNTYEEDYVETYLDQFGRTTERRVYEIAKDGDTANQYQEHRDFVITHCIDEINHCDKEIDRLTK